MSLSRRVLQAVCLSVSHYLSHVQTHIMQHTVSPRLAAPTHPLFTGCRVTRVTVSSAYWENRCRTRIITICGAGLCWSKLNWTNLPGPLPDRPPRGNTTTMPYSLTTRPLILRLVGGWGEVGLIRCLHLAGWISDWNSFSSPVSTTIQRVNLQPDHAAHYRRLKFAMSVALHIFI
jgi:hypothetical protein